MIALRSVLARWETLLVVLILAAMAWSATLSPYYFYLDQILGSTRFFIIPGLMALGLMIVVIQGEIDISLTSTLAVGTTLAATLHAAGWPLAPTFVVMIAVCSLLGMINGILVAGYGLPSLAVTLGTMGAYQGIAYVIGGEQGYSDFPSNFTWLGDADLGIVPVSLLVFCLVCAVVAFFLRNTVFGRFSYAIGAGTTAASFGGVPVRRSKIVAYTAAGALAGLGSWVWIGQYASARADNAEGGILFVVTAVVLGGVSIFGGKGTVLGVMLSLFLLGTLSNGLGLANIAGPTQTLILGTMLVVSIAGPRLFTMSRSRFRARLRGTPGPDLPGSGRPSDTDGPRTDTAAQPSIDSAATNG